MQSASLLALHAGRACGKCARPQTRRACRAPRYAVRASSSAAPSAPLGDVRPPLIYRATSTDPFVNIAIEEWLFKRSAQYYGPVLYLWQNEPSVIIGRSDCERSALPWSREYR